jgi:hypothetical protein
MAQRMLFLPVHTRRIWFKGGRLRCTTKYLLFYSLRRLPPWLVREKVIRTLNFLVCRDDGQNLAF